MPTTLKAFREDGSEVQPGDTITMTEIEHTFRAAIRASNAAGTDGVIAVDGYPVMFSAPFGLTVRAIPDDEPAWEDNGHRDEPGAVRRDIRGPGGFEAHVGPAGGWLIIDISDQAVVTGGIARDHGAGKLAVLEWEREHGLIPGEAVRWFPANTGEPRDKQRDLDVPRGPEPIAGYWAVIGPRRADGRSWGWTVVDGINGDDVASGREEDEASAMDAVAAWEANARRSRIAELQEQRDAGNDYGPDETRELARLTDADVHDTRAEPEPVSLRDALSSAEAMLVPGAGAREFHGAFRLLADAVRTELLAARIGNENRMAPPTVSVTANAGHVTYGVLPTGTTGWWVVMKDGREHVTWHAERDDEGGLHFSGGHYHTTGASDRNARSEALVDLANRAGIFTMLTELSSSGTAGRESFRASHEQVLSELSGTYGVGRARVRAGLLEAAALGRAQISWHDRGARYDYTIRYDRVSCVFTWLRGH